MLRKSWQRREADLDAESCLLGLLPAGADRRVGLAPTGKRRLVTAHTQSGRCRQHGAIASAAIKNCLSQLYDRRPAEQPPAMLKPAALAPLELDEFDGRGTVCLTADLCR